VSYTKRVGLAFTNSLAQRGDNFYFIGSEGGDMECSIYCLTQAGVDKISTPEVDRYLVQLLNSSPDTNTLFSFASKVNNKEIYVLTNKGDTDVGSNRNFSLMYDATTKTWAKWDTQTSYMFPITCNTNFSFRGEIYYMDAKLMGDANVRTFQCALGVPNSYFSDCLTKDQFEGNYYGIQTLLKIPTVDFGTGNRKFLHEMSVSSIAPDFLTHQLQFFKTVGGGRQTVTQSTTNGNNLNFKNWGQFVSGDVEYTMLDATNFTVPGVNASDIRMNGIDMEISQGIT
jgi:hypothetical protein